MKTNLQVFLRTPASHEEFHVEVGKMEMSRRVWALVGASKPPLRACLTAICRGIR